MKKINLLIINIVLFLLATGFSFEPISLSNKYAATSTSDLNKNVFENWTDEKYKEYEDSIFAVLYPTVKIQKSSIIFDDTNLNLRNSASLSSVNNYVPNSVNLDKSKTAGQIIIHPGTSSTGAKTYSVPIDVYPGIKNFNPQLSLTYNSQQGNSITGVGWVVSGIPIISRSNKSIYYDGKPESISLNKNDAFVLNGLRMIKLSETTSEVIYETEQGNIKVKGYLSGSTIRYFEVFYPDGNKGVFGYTTNYTNHLHYPLTVLTDLKGNKIEYAYTYADNHYRISTISYNNAQVVFQYQASRPDPILYYMGGLKFYESNLLNKIICKFGSTILGTYTLSYMTKNNLSFLSKINYSMGSYSYNPLQFYYGEGNIASTYTKTETQLLEWYVADDPSMIKVARGKFDYDSGADGVISLPNLNPYWKHYRHSTAFRHSQNRFDNRYTGNEKIFLYAGLKGTWADPMPNLTTEAGFVDIVCADLEGKQEEYVIKINNRVVNNNDQLTFNVYRSNLYTGLGRMYTRNYNFSTVYKDADGGRSIQPKFYYTGDFNGDGKMEVLAVSCHQPFGDTTKPSKCYVFDLINNRIMYESHLFPFNVDFVGTQQTDPDAAANNTDKVFVIDFDGDGKSDICHINQSGVHFYTFDGTGSYLSARKVTTYYGLTRSDLSNKDLLLGDINGDGLIDLLVSPSKSATGTSIYTWTLYNSKGNGQFDKSTFSGTYKSAAKNNGFILQDVNGDGKADLIKYDTSGFFTYLARNNNVGSSSCYTSFSASKSILIPTDINSHNYFTQLVGLKDGKATKYSFTRNDSKESLATGMVNSLGVIEKNYYQFINEEGLSYGIYSKGYGATFPYVNIQEPISVITSSETFMNGSIADRNNYTYKNAVIHRQGLGFRGFETITSYNYKGKSVTQTFEPYRYSLLKSEESPEHKKTYNYSVSVPSNKILKVRLTSKTEQDKLKGISVNTSFVYDTYGNPTEETATYSGNITIKKTNRYSNNITHANGHYIGFLFDQIVTVTREGSSYAERMYIPAHSSGLPSVKLKYINGNQVKNSVYSYDSYGNVIQETVKNYTSTNSLITSYAYDSYGRLVKVTNPIGLINEYTYDVWGRVATMKDHQGGTTKYYYDGMGREASLTLPDNSVRTTTYAWDSEVANGVFSKTITYTGKPTLKIIYDALNRKVRTVETRFNGSLAKVDDIYDIYGNLQKTSLPFLGTSASLWNTYSYDYYDRLIAVTEASGKKTTYSYSGNTVTTVEDGVSVKKEYDALNNMVRITDAAGSITYNLAADGQPSSIVSPGNINTSFGYDTYRRQISINDPSQGTTNYVYDSSGNMIKETDANGKATNYEYDLYNRLIKKINPEFFTTYSYNTRDEVTSISTSNGTSKQFIYDSYGRIKTWKENGVDGKWLQKEYVYTNGNTSSIKYTSQSGALVTENYYYTNGHLSEMKLNGQTTIYKLTNENSFRQATEIQTGGITRKYNYSVYGLHTGRSANSGSTVLQNYSYTFDTNTNNLLARKDNFYNKTESFAYDNLNRLVTYANKTATYDSKGNITKKSDIGTFAYNNTQKPYAISDVSLASGAIPTRAQNITYSSFRRPNTISENGYLASFTYNNEYKRVKMNITKNNSQELTRYYLGDCYEIDQTSNSTKEKIYLFGDYYNAPAVYIKDNSGSNLYYILRDYLGSVTQIVASNGTLLKTQSYDAWGRLRSPEHQVAYLPGEEPSLFLGRGYTGHEHLPQFGLINMNARLYDPATGRFLSPDPYVQSPDRSQNFNRYSYAMNNPLVYVDPDGEIAWFVPVIIGAVIGAYSGGVIANDGQYNLTKWNYSSGRTWGYMLGGAVVGGVSGYAGWAIAGSGIPMANTAAIAGSSLANSVGTWAYTGGQTPISMSIGGASYDFTNGTLGYLGKKGNKWYENLGYGFGALANLSDAVTLFRGGGQNIKANSAKASKEDWWGHSSITDENGNSLLSVGPDTRVQKSTSLSETWNNSIKGADMSWDTYLGKKGTWSVELNNISTTAISKYASGVSRWDLLLNSCVGHTSRALWGAGVPNVYLFHPHFLNAQLLVRQLGIYSSPYLHQIP